MACLAEIGGALGVDFILASHVGKVGHSFIVNIKLINIQTAKVEGRVYQIIEKEGDVDTLFGTLKRAAHKLFPVMSGDKEAMAKVSAGTVSADSAEKGYKPGAEVGSSSLMPSATKETGSTMAGPGALPIALWAVGVGAVGLGTYFNFRAQSLAEDAWAGDQLAVPKAETSELVSWVGIGVGVASVASGLIAWLVSGDSASEKSVVIAPHFGPGRAGLELVMDL
jgi:hypothetical protein